MILLRRLNGTQFGVNADLIERLEGNPDTVVTLVDGTKYVVSESIAEVVDRIIEFRARVLAVTEAIDPQAVPAEVPPLRLVPEPVVDHAKER